MPTLNASAQSTTSTKVILFIPFSHTLAPYCITQTFCKRKPIYACGRFFHFDAFRSGRSLLSSAPDPSTPLHLHSISHLSTKSKSAVHTCPVLHNINIMLKETKCACGRFFHFDAFRSGRSLLSSAPDPSTSLHLHSISHLSTKSKSAAHPCLCVHTLNILLIATCDFIIRHYPYTQIIKKKAKVSGSPLGCKVKMYF